MTEKMYNFSAGPAALPAEVMQKAQAEFLNWQGCGTSIMEVSHRGKVFAEVAEKTEQNIRELLAIPANYRVLFLSGGATGQFAAVPMNLLRGQISADYIQTGAWANKAIKEAQRYCQVDLVASVQVGEDGNKRLPNSTDWKLNPNAAYLHYTANETIDGIEFPAVPDSGDVPLVSDMSSNILSQPLDVSRFGLIYAGTQKNIGMAGLTLVIVRDDLLDGAIPQTPSILNYGVQAKQDSMYNTPATYAWYMAGLVFEWLLEQGGVAEMAKRAERKAAKLYQAIDTSDFYQNTVDASCRSRINIPFTLRDPNLDSLFLSEAEAVGLLYLKGHRSVGGMRASIYNAMPEEGVDALIARMREFERAHG